MPSPLKISIEEAATPRMASACGFAFSASSLAVMTPVEPRTNLSSIPGNCRLNDSV
jgi:hypothetical protein